MMIDVMSIKQVKPANTDFVSKLGVVNLKM